MKRAPPSIEGKRLRALERRVDPAVMSELIESEAFESLEVFDLGGTGLNATLFKKLTKSLPASLQEFRLGDRKLAPNRQQM